LPKRWREQDVGGDHKQDKANNADHKAKDDPPGLLALPGCGHAPIAIDLGAHRTEQDGKKQDTGPGRAAAEDGSEEDGIDPIEDDQESKRACPARHKSATGKEQKEDSKTGLSKQIKGADQRKPGRGDRRQGVLKDRGESGTAKEHQHKGAKERHPISRAAPEDQRAQGTADKNRDGIQHDLIACQEAERETKLMQKLPIIRGQVDSKTRRAWVTGRL